MSSKLSSCTPKFKLSKGFFENPLCLEENTLLQEIFGANNHIN